MEQVAIKRKTAAFLGWSMVSKTRRVAELKRASEPTDVCVKLGSYVQRLHHGENGHFEFNQRKAVFAWGIFVKVFVFQVECWNSVRQSSGPGARSSK